MTKVKICGITNLEDALLSAKFGADALGFNFYEKSPRYISPEKAREIIKQLPPEVLKVGVFVNEILERICQTAETAKLDAIQLHGEETPDFARELKAKTNLEIIKAFRVSEDFKPEEVLQYAVDAVLLDAYSPKEHGGTGETFDWEIAKRVQKIFPKMYLAGGLSHENICWAISQTKPFATDVCSGIESQKGRKDKIKLINFVTKAKNCQKSTKNLFKYAEPENIYDLLMPAYLKPQMYFGRKKSLTILSTYLNGFRDALRISNSKFATKKFFSEEFHKWMMEKLEVGYPNSLTWAIHIPKKVDNDEEKAFDLFFALLEEFKLEKEDLSND